MSKESYKKYDLPELFERDPRDNKVIVKDLYFKLLKTARIVTRSANERWVTLRVGKQNVISWYKYMPVIIEDNIYTLVDKNIKKKCCIFNYMGPYSDMDNILKENDSTIISR